MIIFAYVSYVLAEALELSGIMSVFWCGIAFNHYGAYSLSAYTTLTSRQLFRTAAFICETCVFIYIGISLPMLRGGVDVNLILWTVLFCFVGRALHVFPLSFLLNLKRKKKLSWQIQIALWFAGLRGAIAFSLAIATDTEHAEYIRTTTLVFVHVTLFVMGCGTLPLLKLLKIKTASSDQSLNNISKPRQKTLKPKSKAATFANTLDEKYMKYYFRRPVQPVAREAIELFERLAGTGGAHGDPEMATKSRSLPENAAVKAQGYHTVLGGDALEDESNENSLFEHGENNAHNSSSIMTEMVDLSKINIQHDIESGNHTHPDEITVDTDKTSLLSNHN